MYNENQIVVYQPNETVRLDVRLENETVWLTQEQMSLLFGRDQSVIARHVAKIFKEGELDRNSVYAKVDRRLAKHDDRLATLEQNVDFFVQMQTPPLQGVFYDGQLWDARALVLELVASAKRSLILIDNWATAGAARKDLTSWSVADPCPTTHGQHTDATFGSARKSPSIPAMLSRQTAACSRGRYRHVRAQVPACSRGIRRH